MTHVDALELWFNDGMGDLWRNVRAMPDEKLDWKPSETSRSARELMEEIVSVMPYNIGVLKEQKSPEMAWDDTKNKSIDQLEAELTKTSADFFAVARAFPEEMLMEDVVLPWTTLKFVEMMAYPYWNMMYHIGQITYIQTLYGDEDIH
jgi:uncharacterized damage-inducible protein DinB